MTDTAEIQCPRSITEEDRARAQIYQLLGVLLGNPPSAELLQGLSSLQGDDTPLGTASKHLAALAERHARAQDLGAQLAGDRLVASLPGLEYFARAYGLDIVPLAWTPGETPGPADLDALGAALPARIFLWQEEPDDAARAAVAERGPAQAVIDPGAGAAADFLALVDRNLDSLASAIESSE